MLRINVVAGCINCRRSEYLMIEPSIEHIGSRSHSP